MNDKLTEAIREAGWETGDYCDFLGMTQEERGIVEKRIAKLLYTKGVNMPCVTCSHTMQNLGLNSQYRRVFWCPRCGTLKDEALVKLDTTWENGDIRTDEAIPKLVGRCRSMEDKLYEYRAVSDGDEAVTVVIAEWWTGLDIQEAINIPDNRKAFG